MKDQLIANHDTPGWKAMLKQARINIHDALSDYPNFEGVYFSDGYNGMVLMVGENRQFPNKEYGGYFPINSTLSDLNRVVRQFIANWKQIDTEDYRAIYKQLLEGEDQDAQAY